MRGLAMILALLPVIAGLPTVGWFRPDASAGMIRDDVIYVLRNPDVIYPGSIARTFTTGFPGDLDLGLYRPLATLSLRLDFVLSDVLQLPWSLDRAFLPHLVNLLIASATAVVLFLLLARLSGSPAGAAIGAALFALHPARTEAVFWVSGRAEGLMTLFATGSMLAATARSPGFARIAAPALAVAAALSKEQGFVLALLLPLMPFRDLRFRLQLGALAAAGLAAVFAWRWYCLGAPGPAPGYQVLQGIGLPDRVPIGLEALSGYLRLLFWPFPLLNEYDEIRSPTGIPPLLPALAFLLAAGFAWARRWMLPRFACLWFLLPLLPVLNIATVTGESFAERFLSLPAGALALAVAILWSRLERRVNGRIRRPIAAACALGVLALCGLASFLRAFDYKSEEAMVEALLRDAPRSGAAYRLAAGIPRRERQFDIIREDRVAAKMHGEEALRLLRAAVERNPEQAASRLELARLLVEIVREGGREDRELLLAEATGQLSRALELAPRWPEGRRLLGEVHLLSGDGEEGLAILGSLARQDPFDGEAAMLLIAELEQRGRAAEARAAMADAAVRYEELAAARPRRSADPRYRLRIAKLRWELRPESGGELLETLRPENLDAPAPPEIVGAASLAVSMARRDPRLAAQAERILVDSVAYLENLLRSRSERAAPMEALARIYMLQGDRERAVAHLHRAAALAPHDAIRQALLKLAESLESSD